MKRFMFLLSVLVLITLACSSISSVGGVKAPAAKANDAQNEGQEEEVIVDPTETATSTLAPEPTATIPPTNTPTATPIVVGPSNYPKNVNPLTGLPVSDPSLLALSPVLVSVTNFPITARPQAGLSYCPFVFEITIGEGMTRFLALFYGDYPKEAVKNLKSQPGIGEQPGGQSESQSGDQSIDQMSLAEAPEIGPIRSKRLPFDNLSKLYNGFLIGAGASPEVAEEIGSSQNVFGDDPGNINGNMLKVTDLQDIAEAQSRGSNIADASFQGNQFAETLPAGGTKADKLWVFYSINAQILWKYDPTSGAYLRYQDEADYQGKFVPATDRLNGKQLAFDNVIVLKAVHESLNSAGTLIDIKLKYIKRFPAYFFRDGKMYEIYWTTISEEYEKKTGKMRPIRFIDAEGNPFPFKPGNTWVEIVDTTAEIWEISESNPSNPAPGSGYWKVRFYPPVNP